MPLPSSIPISQRFSYFEQQAQKGDPRAQHSIGLLLWNGFTSSTEQTSIDPEASAVWHAAAALQGNLDALAVFGGCLRTGTGVGKCKNIALGLRCIEYSASVGNPSGVNKKGAMMESNDDYFGAMRLYRECYEDESKRTNALLLFNLGYCLIHGDGVDNDVEEGEKIWRYAVVLAPEEGSEEAAWFLYQQYSERVDMEKARHYLDIAADLGLEDAVMERRDNS
jgi:TPR repeat protein